MSFMKKRKVVKTGCMAINNEREDGNEMPMIFSTRRRPDNIRVPNNSPDDRNPFIQIRPVEDPDTGETVPMMIFNKCRQHEHPCPECSELQHTYAVESPNGNVRIHASTTSIDGRWGSNLSVCSTCYSPTSPYSPQSSDIAVADLRGNLNYFSFPGPFTINDGCEPIRTFNVRDGLAAPPPSPNFMPSDISEPSIVSTWTQQKVSNSQSQSSFETACTGTRSGVGSLEWDNYMPPVGASYNNERAANARDIALSNIQYWV